MRAAARKVAERGKEGQALDSLRGVYYREGRQSSRERRGEKRRGEDGGGRQALWSVQGGQPVCHFLSLL